ncbi:MAG: hypothetical protein RL367_921 [Pseudomonadota bacterium]
MSFTLAILAASAANVLAPPVAQPSPQLSYGTDLSLLSDTGVASSPLISLVRAGQPPVGKASALDDDATPSSIKFSPSITLVSDYRFRGISLSGRDPAIQGGLEVTASGFYAGAWASTIAPFVGSHVELDVYGGWRGAVAGLDLDIGATNYLYPGGQGGHYVELLGSAGHTIGPVELKAGVGYAPKQKTLGSDNVYAWGQARSGIPGTPVSLTASAGHESGSLAGPVGQKWDWSLGAEAVYKRFTAGVKYVDTSIHRVDDPDKVAQAGVVASLGWAF